MIELRDYQREAVEHALKAKRSTLVLPTGTGKTIIGAFFLKRLFESGRIRRAIVIVPTRILVEQTHNFYRSLGLNSEKVYGIFSKNVRAEVWKKAEIAISTPETVYNDLDVVGKVDAVVVDECHHAVGNDAYAKVLKEIYCEYKLGLSAFIPRRRRKEIEELIGEIREWSVESLKGYVAEWIGEVFESRFNGREMEVYDEIDRRRCKAKGSEKLVYTSALKFFSKDGALALKESLSRETKLSKLLEDLKDEIMKLRDLHKINYLFRALELYEGFEKAIVFVERVIVAKKLSEILSKKFDTALIVGRKERKEEDLERAKEAKIVVSTSAGEEGVDLPTADLLINWSNTSSPLRFIQRHGRIMRNVGKPVKFVVYLVTPDTIDVDDLLASIEQAKRIIDVNIDKDALEELWKASRRRKIIEFLTEPMPMEWLVEVSGRTLAEVRFALKKACEEGEVVYIYTHLGKTYIRVDHIKKLEKFSNFLNPVWEGKVKINGSIRGDYLKLKSRVERRLPLQKLEIVVAKRVGDVIEFDRRVYNFRIASSDVLDIVLRNALSF
ncbi:DEAD/DEAH box helicase family protein [Archaeoglobus sp.]